MNLTKHKLPAGNAGLAGTLRIVLGSPQPQKLMSYDDDWPDQTLENRRVSILTTIRPISHDELKKLGEARFPVVTDPWCTRYHDFINKNATATFYRAESPEGAEVIYCRDTSQGVWFLPGKGMGIIQPRGLQILAEIANSL